VKKLSIENDDFFDHGNEIPKVKENNNTIKTPNFILTEYFNTVKKTGLDVLSNSEILC
jgi:hypothetical protein